MNEEHIQYVLENFDFNRVERAMKSLNWEWNLSIPTHEDLIKMAKDLLYGLIDNDTTEMACGGFRAERIIDGDDEFFRLTFCVTEWDSMGYDEL